MVVTTREDKIKGALYGFAIGDAMGAVAEFETRESIEKKYGRITEILGGGWLKLQPGEVTDDTQMTFCIFDAVIDWCQCMRNADEMTDELGIDVRMTSTLYEFIAQYFIQWKQSGPKDIGNLCMNGITLLEQGSAPEYDQQALGNGSLMRALPFALIGDRGWNVEQGLMTHNNCKCTEAIINYTDVICGLVNVDFEYNYPLSNVRPLDPSGHVMNTFNNSMYWAMSARSFREAVENAVNDGGDADTIGAITGSIAGARFGYDNIPREWIETLDSDVKRRLDKYANFIICREYHPYL